MCGIGSNFVTVSCGSTTGPTDAPLTTKEPCEDKWSNCPDLAKEHCYQDRIGKNCRKSCGKCKGMTPAASNTCYNPYGNCASICSWYTGTERNLACGKC